jgi:hypothetical protein
MAFGRNANQVRNIEITKNPVNATDQNGIGLPRESASPRKKRPKIRKAKVNPSTMKQQDLYRSSLSSAK